MRFTTRAALACLVSIGVLAAACSSGHGSPTPTSPLPAASSSPPAAASPTAPAGTPPPLAEVHIERAFPALGFARMTGLYTAPDGSGRLYVTEKHGRVLVFDNRQDVSKADVFLDITDRVSDASNEEGLLGLAFAPDYATSGNLYVYYSLANPRRTVVSRFHADPRAGVADKASEQRLLEIPEPFPNHKGGQLAFGPDGYLYIGVGDGGSEGDPQGNGQDLTKLLAKILRIDVSGPQYSIPPDNPFVGQASKGVREETWAYGLRNPWRFSFDPATKALWAGDVGQDKYEEIDVVTKGGNYGWSTMEGMHCYKPASGCDQSGLILPVFEYDHSGGNCAIIGGAVYHARAIASLRGAYVYADYCSGRVWALRYDGSRVTEQIQIAKASFQVSSIGEDSAGELYLLADSSSDGGIYRLVP